MGSIYVFKWIFKSGICKKIWPYFAFEFDRKSTYGFISMGFGLTSRLAIDFQQCLKSVIGGKR